MRLKKVEWLNEILLKGAKRNKKIDINPIPYGQMAL
jgi:hypothetical protein